MATTSPVNSSNHAKTAKNGGSSSRRKISLPWFRQASIGEKLTKLRLPRQNTVDCSNTSSAPATAVPCPSSDKLSHFRRKVLSGSASVEVRNQVLGLTAFKLDYYCFHLLWRLLFVGNIHSSHTDLLSNRLMDAYFILWEDGLVHFPRI